MWEPGTFLLLKKGRGLDHRSTTVFNQPTARSRLCLVIASAQLKFGTKGPTYRVLVLVENRLYNLEVNGVALDRDFVVYRGF